MGGALAIASSVLIPKVDAVVGFYGVPSSELADPAQAKAPVQVHFGELDSYVGFSDVTVKHFILSPSLPLFSGLISILVIVLVNSIVNSEGTNQKLKSDEE